MIEAASCGHDKVFLGDEAV